MDNLRRIPKVFFVDHMERDLPTPEIVKETKRHFYIRGDDPALADLIDDARHYADPWGPGDSDSPLRPAARALLAALDV